MDKQLIDAVKEIITKAGKIALEIRDSGLEIEIKKDNSPVTNADKELSNYIFTKLSKLKPSIPVICEERPLFDVSDIEKFWLVDPIDGTRSFIKNRDSFTVNIAMIDNKKPTYGFVYLPSQDKLYFTDEKKGFCIEVAGQAVSSNAHKQDGFVAVVSSHSFNAETENYLKGNEFSEIIAIPSSIKLCMIAEGAGDVYPKFGSTMEWDIAAGHAVLKVAGGNICTLDGFEVKYAKENFQNPYFIAVNKRWSESEYSKH